MVVEDKLSFQEIMLKIRPYLMVAAITGTEIFIGLLMIFGPALKSILGNIRKPKYSKIRQGRML